MHAYYTECPQSKGCCTVWYLWFFLTFDFCRFGWSFGFFITPQRPMTSDFERIFYPKFYPLHLFSYLNSWERASIFPFECSVINKGTTGTIFITSLVWRGPWLGIEPGTSHTQSQRSTTRLSRRRCLVSWTLFVKNVACNNYCWLHIKLLNTQYLHYFNFIILSI